VKAVVVVSALAFAAGLLTLALLAKPTQAQVRTETLTERTPFEFEPFANPCTGEQVFVEGTQTFVFHVTEQPNGAFFISGVNKFQGRAVGASGVEYVYREIARGHFNVTSSSAENFTNLATVKLIPKGSPEDAFKLTFFVRYTINANGEVTSEIIKFEEDCASNG
jgi:hypothetical protein